ncbi:MAG: DUF222 domain-containing protein, partial [Ilumatobacteraceae bacterium]
GLAETVGLAALDSSAEMAAMAEMAEMAGSAVPDGPPRSSTIGQTTPSTRSARSAQAGRPSRSLGASGAAGELAAALACIAQGLDDIGAVDPVTLQVDDLAAGALELQRLADRVQVALARLLVRADRIAVWQGSGSKNAAGWLADTTGSGYGAACDLLRLGDSLEASAMLADKVDGGEMSAATAVALHRTIAAPPERATPADVARLVEMCAGASPAEARKAAEIWKDGHRIATPDELEAQRFARRSVRFAPEVDGIVRTTADLPTLEAHMLRKALTSVGGRPSDDDRRTTEQRLADALVTLADRALHRAPQAALAPATAIDGVVPALDAGPGAASSAAQESGSAPQAASAGPARPSRAAVPGSGRQRVDLLVTIDLQSLVGHDDPALDRPGIDEFGGRIPAHVVRRLAENASIERIVHAGSRVLDHGRAVRLATDDQYRALVARDGGCRWPGCDKPASWCEVDHLVPWQLGGRTDLDNLVLLCAAHHTEKHRAGTVIVGDATDLEIVRPDGIVMWCPPKGVMAGSAAGGELAGTRALVDAGATADRSVAGSSHGTSRAAGSAPTDMAISSWSTSSSSSSSLPSDASFTWPLPSVSAVRSRLLALVPSMLTTLTATAGT